MKEEVFNRGQYVYREGIDPVDKMYLIKQGEFELLKTLVVNKQNQFDIFGKKNQETDQETSKFCYTKFKQFSQKSSFSLRLRKTGKNEVQISRLSNHDIFGFQEFMEKDLDVRSCTVRCLKPNSVLIALEKTQMLSIVRRNPISLDDMKMKWAHFVV